MLAGNVLFTIFTTPDSVAIVFSITFVMFLIYIRVFYAITFKVGHIPYYFLHILDNSNSKLYSEAYMSECKFLSSSTVNALKFMWLRLVTTFKTAVVQPVHLVGASTHGSKAPLMTCLSPLSHIIFMTLLVGASSMRRDLNMTGFQLLWSYASKLAWIYQSTLHAEEPNLSE